MKKFKSKGLVSLAILCMSSTGLVGCNLFNKDDKTPEEPESNLPKELLDEIYVIDQTYKNKDNTVSSKDFEVVSKISDAEDREFTITWSVEIKTADATNAVKVVAGKDKDGNDSDIKTLIDIDEESPKDVEYVLKGVVKYGDYSGNTAPLTMKVPALHIAGWDEYVELCSKSGSSKGDEKNTTISVEGIVTTIIGTANGNSSQAVYAQSLDNKGAFYAYGLADDPSTKVHVGQKVRLTGETGLYSGSYELLGPSISKIFDDADAMPAPIDYTAKFTNATAITDADLVAAQGLYVTLKDVEITDENVDSGYYNFALGGKTSYVRISSSVCPISKANQDKLKADHAAKRGYIADVKGIICTYSGAFYLTPIDAEPFNFKSLPPKTDAEAVAFEKDALSINTDIKKNIEITLPAKGGSYDDVAITWDFKAETTHTTAAIADGKLAFTLGEAAETVTVVATLKRGSVTETKEFVINVPVLSTDPFIINAIQEAKEGTYYFGLQQAKRGEYLFADGTVNDSGYLATTDSTSKAGQFAIAGDAENGYTIKSGDKFVELYVTKKDNAFTDSVRIQLVDASTAKWAWNEEAKVFTWAISDCKTAEKNGNYYLGTYNTYNTISASLISYITGANASKVGTDQFPGYFGNLKAGITVINGITEAKAGTYNLGLYQAKRGEYLFADGTVNDSGYLATTDSTSKAGQFVIAGDAENGYTIKSGDKFVELYVTKKDNAFTDSVRIQLVDASTAKWAWNEEAKVFTWAISDCKTAEKNGNYYLGTYNTYNTISASLISYITGANASKVGTDQFVGCYGLFAVREATVASKENAKGTYTFGLNQVKRGEFLFADGTVTDAGYLATTDKASKAGKFVIDGDAENGYTIKVGEKFVELYVTKKDNAFTDSVRIQLVDASTAKWAWNEEAKVFTWAISDCKTPEKNGNYYLGTYNTYNTISASLISYITGANASKVGTDQFVGRYGFVAEYVAPAPAAAETPAQAN